MPAHKATSADRLARLLAVLVISLGAIGLAPASPAASAAPALDPAPANVAGLLPSPPPTINVNTLTIANNGSDGKCDLWEAMSAAEYADLGDPPTYNECTGVAGDTNVIGFVGPAAGGTIEVPPNVNGGFLPFAFGNLTLLGPVTIKPSAALTETHLLQLAGDANLTLIGVTLTGAHTSGSGAAIFDFNHATINLIGSNITNNTAENSGGGIESDGNLNISLSNFSGNTAVGSNGLSGDGGAIHINGSGNLTIAKSSFAGNVAKGGGGALNSTLSYATIEDSIFTGNVAGQMQADHSGGGAIFNNVNGALGIARTQFAGNLTPQGNGGAIFNNSGAGVAISDTTFAANLAGDLNASHVEYGGAIYNQALAIIRRSSFVNNNAPYGHGGALAVDSAGTADVANSTFAANTTPNGFGGAVIITQTQAGGPASTLIARNVTIALNAAPSNHGAGIYDATGQNLQIGNTILATNPLENCAGSGNLDNLGHNLDSGTSCNFGNGDGNISSGSADLGGPSFNGGPIASMLTMAPDVGSDAIDHGDNAICAAAPVFNEDQRGDTRPKDGSHFGTNYCDIGAFEADAAKAGFGSAPSEPGPINVGSTAKNTTVTTTLVLSNTGEWPLDILNIALTGPDASKFSVSATPISIVQHSAPVNLVISCTPTVAGPLSAALGFATSDTPLHAVVGFLLKCTGFNAAAPGYGSLPIAPGPIVFPDTLAFGGTHDTSFKVIETGDATLNVTGVTLSGPNAAEFQILTSTSFSISNGGAPSAIALRCLPADYGLRTATLTVHTNDTNQPSVAYTLTCRGVPPPSEYLLTGTSQGNFSGNLSGAYGLAISPNSKYVFASSSTSARVSMFTRNLVTGVLTFDDLLDNPFNYLVTARLVAVSPDNKSVYAAGQGSSKLVDVGVDLLHDSYLLPPHGHSEAQLNGAYGVSVSPDGKNVYATGVSSNSVVVYTRNLASGALTFLSANVSAGQLGGAHGLAISPDGQNVYVAGHTNSSTNGTLEVLKRSALNGSLMHVQLRSQGDTIDGSAIFGMKGAFQVAVSPDGANVYLAATGDGAVVSFSRNPLDGSLTWLDTFVCGCGAVNGLQGASGIDVSPDGLHVVADGFNGMAAVAFDRNPVSGQLTFQSELTKADSGAPLDGARDLRLSPDGHTVYVAAYNDSAIAVLPVANPVPFINNLSPASAPQGGGAFTLHVYGANFIQGSHAGSFPTTYISPNQLDVTISAATLATAGPKFIQIVNPQPIGDNTYSIPFYLQVIAPANHPIPSIDHITPQGGLAGGSALTLDVFGTNFINGSTVRWNGNNRATTFVDATHLQAAIPQSDVSQPGTSSVSVFTGGPGGGASNLAAFTVAQPGQNAAPSAASLSPAWVFSYGAASKQVQVTVTGKNFIEGSVVQMNGANRPTDYVDASHLKVTIYGSDLLAPTSVAITVFTPAPGGGSSSPLTFSVRQLHRLLLPMVRR